MYLLRVLASLKLTLFGMVLLGLATVVNFGNPLNVSVWVLIVPMALLAINICAAIITNSKINRQPGLLVFHVCLLSIVLLAGWGRLTHMDGRLEIPFGQEFHPDLMFLVQQGPLHHGNIRQLKFIQGHYTVNYKEQLRRQHTRSEVWMKDDKGNLFSQIVGDDSPLLFGYYRFYTTHNKGFAPILTWKPNQGEAVTGSINMPSYPLFEYKQANEWKPPGTDQEIKFWLQLNTGLTREQAWVLDSQSVTGTLIVTVGEKRKELNVGDSIQMPEGTLQFTELRSWMGYRIFYDPTIYWMFWVSFVGVLGLTQFFYKKMANRNWILEKQDEHEAKS